MSVFTHAGTERGNSADGAMIKDIEIGKETETERMWREEAHNGVWK